MYKNDQISINNKMWPNPYIMDSVVEIQSVGIQSLGIQSPSHVFIKDCN
jgi:hypothetical protein